MANGHGGARKGAGRPRNQEKYAEQIATFHDSAANDLDDRYAALQLLADGGFEEEEEEEVWEPAGLVQITKEVITSDGRSVNMRELAFPHLDPQQLVCVQRKKKKRTAAPDRQANQYLIDRVAGKPTAFVEGEMTVDAGDALIAKFETAVTKIYGAETTENTEDAE